jgi:glycosyltransferase involved in cell wall biosynthesis
VRVLFNTYAVAFDCPGGGEIQLLKCRQALGALGIDVLLFDPWRPQFDHVDLVHYFSVQGGSMNFCAHVKERGLPLVISPVLWLTDDNRAQFPMTEIRDLLHLCDRILPNSLAERDQLAEAFELSSGKFSVVPNGVDPEFGVPADPGIFRSNFGILGPFLLNVANIEPRKNQHRLARMARQMETTAVLVGRVRDAKYLAHCLDEGGNFLRHLGPLEHESPLLKSAYAACSLFVLPSLLETPGLAALEAAAQGARVVITDVGSTQEYFGDLANYVDPTDEREWRAVIEAKLSARRDDRLCQHVLNHYTWSAAGDALVEAYTQTLAQGPVHADEA